MKLSELARETADALARVRSNYQDADREVGIPLARSSIGGSALASVRGVGLGFDWDANVFFITPSSRLDLVQVRQDVPYSQIASERLDKITAAFKKMGFKYGISEKKCATRQAWLDGFEEALKMRFDEDENKCEP